MVYILLMDPILLQQVELRDLMTIKAKTNPKPLNGRLYNFHAVLLPLFVIIIILLVSYFLPGLRCYFCPASISCAKLVSLLANKKALFLFSNFIFILLVVDFTLSSSPSNSFTSTLHNDNHSASLDQGHLPTSEYSNAILVGDAPAVAEQLHDDSSLWISSSRQVVEEVISLEQKSTISVDSFAEEKKLAKEESTKTNNIDIFGDFLTEIGDRIDQWRPEYCNKSDRQQGRLMKTVERGNIPTLLEVVVVDDAIGKERTELEAFGIELDELEHLELEELNRKFDEFIARKKNKWRSEALQLVTHGRLV